MAPGLVDTYSPNGGHRGALYSGDLFAIAQRAAVRPDLRFTVSMASKAYYGTYEDQVSCWAGNWAHHERHKLRRGHGHFGNVRQGMIPEFNLAENASDPDTGLLAHGWRALVKRWLGNNVIYPTEEVRTLLGECVYSQLKLAR